jgi:tRNA 2-thiouridine synthesizing protein A
VNETRIDARGMRCPWPVIRLAKAFREGAERVTILADDPIAHDEITALAKAQGWAIVAEDAGNCWHLAVNPVFLQQGV